MLPDKNEYRKRVLLRIFSSPWSLVPIVTGITSLLSVWATGVENPHLWIFSSICCVLAGIGIGFSRLILNAEDEGKKVIEKMKEEQKRVREEEFDELEQNLKYDGDPRTQTYLRDLRTLTQQFLSLNNDFADVDAKIDAYTSMEIAFKVEQLFKQSVQSLRRTYQLWNTTNSLKSPKAKTPLLKVREKIIQDVGKSIEQLSKSLADLQTICASSVNDESELEKIRTELDKKISSANSLKKEITDMGLDSIDDKIKAGEYDEYLEHSQRSPKRRE